MATPADKVRVIEQSLRCFVFGCLSLIPLLGLPFAILAVMRHRNAGSQGDGEWNPAKAYLVWGFGLAWLGGLISLGALAIFVVALTKLFEF
jgi:hypothetical protein